MLAVLVAGPRTDREDPGFFVLLFELFTAGRHNPDIQRELAELSSAPATTSPRSCAKRRPRACSRLRYDAEAVVTYLFAAADGVALQRLTDPERDYSATVEAGAGVARFLLTSE